MKIAFVILNYKNVDDTLSCIESIKALSMKEYMIVVVDNGSKDNSVEKLNDRYKEDENIRIIVSEDNLGFSKGNNLGYDYVRNNYKADFVVVTNNDILFPQKDFEQRLWNVYQKTGFMVLGPDIYVRKTKEHQSPMMLSLPTKEQVQKELEVYEYYLDHPDKWAKRRKLQITKNRLCQKNKLFAKIYGKVKKKNLIDVSKSYENCCVQGACIVISKEYLDKEEKMFSPEPFLYCEEIFLYAKCLKKGYKIVYDPTIQIWHEDSSTIKKISGDAVAKAKFTLPNHVKARKMLVEYLDV